MKKFDELIKREHQRIDEFARQHRDRDFHHVTSVYNAVEILKGGLYASLSFGQFGIWLFNEVPIHDYSTPGFPPVPHRYILARQLLLPVYADITIAEDGITGELLPDFGLGYLSVEAPRYQLSQFKIESRFLTLNGVYKDVTSIWEPSGNMSTTDVIRTLEKMKVPASLRDDDSSLVHKKLCSRSVSK